MVDCFFPCVDYKLISFFVGHKSAFVFKSNLINCIFCFLDITRFSRRDFHVGYTNGNCASCGVFEALSLDFIKNFGGFCYAVCTDTFCNDFFKNLFSCFFCDFKVKQLIRIASVHETEVLRNAFVEDKSTNCSINCLVLHYAINFFVYSYADWLVQSNNFCIVSKKSLVFGRECFHCDMLICCDEHIVFLNTLDCIGVGEFNRLIFSDFAVIKGSNCFIGSFEFLHCETNDVCDFALFAFFNFDNFGNTDFIVIICFNSFFSTCEFKFAVCNFRSLSNSKLCFAFCNCEVEASENHVLCRNGYRVTVLRFEQVVCRKHKETCFSLSFRRKRKVNSHLVTVEVGVVSCTYKRMKSYCTAFNKNRFKRLDTQSVKCRSTVKEHRMFFDNFFKYIPYCFVRTFYFFLSIFYVMSTAVINKLFHNERLEQLKCHFFRKSALINFQFRSYNDNGTT